MCSAFLPQEIQDVPAGDPPVLETAVIGVPDGNGKKSSSPMCSHDQV
jgi:acyl-CoA synthetase (AMP-forming)/AMP-acid ligase II